MSMSEKFPYKLKRLLQSPFSLRSQHSINMEDLLHELIAKNFDCIKIWKNSTGTILKLCEINITYKGGPLVLGFPILGAPNNKNAHQFFYY